MEPLVFETRLCLNGVPVPGTHRVLDLVDMDNEMGGDLSEENFFLVSIKASADMHCFLKVLKLPCKWWRDNFKSLPIASEIRNAIEDLKNKMTSGCKRSPRRPDVVVPLTIRGKMILVLNHTLSLSLALKPGEEAEVLTWFLMEIKKDGEILRSTNKEILTSGSSSDLGGSSSGVKPSKQKTPEEGPESELVQEVLDQMAEHPQCLSAIWMPSRDRFRVTRKDKNIQEFKVQALNKKRKEAQSAEGPHAWDCVKAQLDAVVHPALQFLEGSA